jgi:hypothetical protein
MSFANFSVLVFIRSLEENKGVYVELQRNGIKVQWHMIILAKINLYDKRCEDNFFGQNIFLHGLEALRQPTWFCV